MVVVMMEGQSGTGAAQREGATDSQKGLRKKLAGAIDGRCFMLMLGGFLPFLKDFLSGNGHEIYL